MAQVIMTVDLAKELEGKRVAVVAVHPAGLMDTRMVEKAGAVPQSTVADGAASVVPLVLKPNIPNGAYFFEQTEARAVAQAYDVNAQMRLRAISDSMTARYGKR
jgi:NAD(P)-dependent dehydrogenase (short-subunit alcohol dehydrogenase family)